MEIFEISEFCNDIQDAVSRLLPQLSATSQPITEENLKEIIESSASRIFLAKENNQYIGCLTLTIVRIPTGLKGWIEDVVVDEAARGKGVGAELVNASIALANKLGVKTINLTSSPSREAANHLYKKLGFKQRKTNVYQYEIK